MSNQLIPLKEMARELLETLNALSRAEQAAFIYGYQTVIGGFPRDLEQERAIGEALNAGGASEQAA